MDKKPNNKETFKSFLKSFTPYQTIYLAAVVALTAVLVIFFPQDVLGEYQSIALIVCAIVSTISNPLCELLISKQRKWNFVVDFFLIEIPELVICLHFGWYAVAATVVLFWMPIDVISYLRWNKYPDQEDENLTQVKRLKPWQSLLVVGGILLFGFTVGQLLQLIPGASDTYLDAFASAVGMTNGILLLLRYSEQWLAWLITTVLYLFMDISSGMYILLVTEIAMLVNTIYGIVKWWMYTKRVAERDKSKTDSVNTLQ
jgi:nicotinamide mononucleotide transporter